MNGSNDPDEPGTGRLRAVHIAAGKGDKDMLRTLFAYGADANALDCSGGNAMQAVGIFDPSVARVLLHAGADVHNAKNDIDAYPGWQIIHWATVCDNIRLVQLLITWGADAMARTKDGDTPLDLAQAHGRDKAAAYLTSVMKAETASEQAVPQT